MAADRQRDSLATILERIFDYPLPYLNKSNSQYQDSINSRQSNVYQRLELTTLNRNAIMMTIPYMFDLIRGRKHFISEQYSKLTYKNYREHEWENQLSFTTLPRYSVNMQSVSYFYVPYLYDNALFGNNMILSPFVRGNRRYYNYSTEYIGDTCYVTYKPIIENTMLVTGRAKVNPKNGQVFNASMSGRYDLFRYNVNVTQGKNGLSSIYPEKVRTDGIFRFLGNKQRYVLYTDLASKAAIPDSLKELEDRKLVDSYRTEPLTKSETSAYNDYDKEIEDNERRKELKEKNEPDTITKKSSKWADFFSSIGDRMWSTTHRDVGKSHISISPLLNPMSLEYSGRKGLAYQLTLSLATELAKNRQLLIEPFLGYNFKQHLFYYRVPIQWVYNTKRGNSLAIELGNGNPITNSAIYDELRDMGLADSLLNDELEDFRDNYYQISNTTRLTKRLVSILGVSYHHRTALNTDIFKEAGEPYTFRAFAPFMELKYHLWDRGPMFAFNYEQGLRDVFGGDLTFSRLELDYTQRINKDRMRAISLRGGAGLFFSQDGNYFIDFKNFRSNNLPEGWLDEWTGNFQMLEDRYYNYSKYYLRANLTYESPLLFLYKTPLIGKFIETERIYLNTLYVTDIHPYVEIGYGLRSRFFSMALYTNMYNMKLHSIECKINIELFNY